MDSDVLAQILAEPTETATPATPATPQPKTVEEQTKVPDEQVDEDDSDEGAKPAPKPEKPVDPDLKWDDDEEQEDKPDVVDDPAPDQVTDAELTAIEERNRWMKGRLAPVKTKLTAAEAENARLKAELEALKAGSSAPPVAPAAVDAPKTLDEYVSKHPDVVALETQLRELEDKADSMTMGEYTDARLDILSDLKLAKREIKHAVISRQQAEAASVAQAETRIQSDFETAVLSKKDELPGIDIALKRLDKNASNLDPEIRRAIVLDGDKINPLAAELVHIIGNDRQAMSYLLSQSKAAQHSGRVPLSAIEYLGRLKAKIIADRQAAPDDEAPDVETTVASAPRRRASVPREIRTAVNDGNDQKDLKSWAQDMIKAGKRPW